MGPAPSVASDAQMEEARLLIRMREVSPLLTAGVKFLLMIYTYVAHNRLPQPCTYYVEQPLIRDGDTEMQEATDSWSG